MAKVKIIRITARKDGFRRAGMAHSTTPTDHPADSITKEQLAALKAEPMLTVQELEVDEKKPAAEK